MDRSLPLHPNLEAIEKEARHLLHEVRRGSAAAVARWHSLDPEALTGQPRMADMQYLIAREYGFSSWQSMKASLQPPLSHMPCSHRQSEPLRTMPGKYA